MQSLRIDSFLAMAANREGSMPIYFRGPEALISHREFIRTRPPTRVYAIREIRHPHVVITKPTVTRPRPTHPARRLGRRHSYELHAIYRGRWVCLFRTPDLRLFGQIKRALVRAIEAQAEYTALG